MDNHANQAIQNQAHVADLLSRLARTPHHSLILEGGTSQERRELARYFLQLLHCAHAKVAPCQECDPCHKILEDVFRDLFWLDPQAGLKVDDIRQLRPTLAQKPSYRWRMIVITEAQDLNPACANALLKSVEEPVSQNCFVFLAGQREHLMSTLVSRSYILTLGRKPEIALDADQELLYQELTRFVRSGQGFMDKTSYKNVMSLDQARQFLSRVQADLSRSMRQDYGYFQHLGPNAWHRMCLTLRTAEEALNYNVRIDLVLQWLALTFWHINRTGE